MNWSNSQIFLEPLASVPVLKTVAGSLGSEKGLIMLKYYKECHNCGMLTEIESVKRNATRAEAFQMDSREDCPWDEENYYKICNYCGAELYESDFALDDMYSDPWSATKENFKEGNRRISEFEGRIYQKYIKGDPKKEELYHKRIEEIQRIEEEYAREREEEEAELKLLKSTPRPASNPTPTQVPLNLPHCPTCGSCDVQKISAMSRGTSIILFGLFSKKLGKTFKCNNCGYMW